MELSLIFKRLLFISFLSTLFLLPLVFAHAQSGAGIGLRPATIEGPATPGETQVHTVSVTNLSNTTQTYYLFTRDIIGVEGAGVPLFADDNQEKTGFEMTDWISLDTEEVTLAPGEEKDVAVTIAVPQNATPCSHFGAVFVSMDPPRLRSTGASVGYEVANIISLRVAGECVEDVQIRSFSTGNFIYGKSVIDFSARLENKGTTLVRPIGPLEVKNMFGKKVALLTMNENKSGIFPGTERTFDITWEDEGPGFGRYEAVLSMVYGDQGRQSTISSTASFWILPMNIILPALGVLAVILLVTFVSVRLYVNRAIRGYTGSRRVVRRRRGGMSALLLVAVVMLAVTALFLIILLALFA